MRTLWKRIPTGWKLVLKAAALLILVFAWSVVNVSSVSAETVFRRGLENACYPAAEMELLAEARCDSYNLRDVTLIEQTTTEGLGTDANHAYLVQLSEERGRRSYSCWSTPAVAEDVWYLPLFSEFGTLAAPFRSWILESSFNQLTQIGLPQRSCFAVKAPGASASLTLIVDAWEDTNSSYDNTTSYAKFPLILQEHQNGWFLFRFDTTPLLDAQNYDLEIEYSPYYADASEYRIRHKEPYASLLVWASCYTSWPDCPPAHLELTTYDEAGRILKTLQWDLRPAE